MTFDFDATVVGAGAVGLACGRALSKRGLTVLVLEREPHIGQGVSSRNSEVIHGGLYYPSGSLKARFCVEGRRRLYAFLESRKIEHWKCGKLVVATEEAEVERIEAIFQQATTNDVEGLEHLTGAQARALEPALNAHTAILSPESGVFDSHGYMLSLRGDIEEAGGALAFHAPLLRAKAVSDGFEVEIGGDAPMALHCRTLINSGGLSAPAVARAIEGMPPDRIPTSYYAKGNYFSCATRAPFSRLIYPVPEAGGLGVHLTIDLGGQAKFGPDVEWIESPDAASLDYAVDPARADRFYPAIRRYWPALPDGALTPSYSGVRPKIVPPAIARQDFVIQGPQDHGLSGLINLFGIESPGLTSSLAIADEVARTAGLPA